MPEPKDQLFASTLRQSTSYMLKRCQHIFELNLEAEQIGAPYMLRQIPFELLVACCALRDKDQSIIGGAIGIDKSSATIAIDTLEGLKLLKRREQADRRRRSLVPAAKAPTVVGAEFEKRRRAGQRFMAHLSVAEQEIFLDALSKLAHSKDTSAPAWRPVIGAQTDGVSDSMELLQAAYRNPGFLLRRGCQIGRGFTLSSLPAREFTEGQAKLLYLVCAAGQTDMPTLQKAFATERPTLLVILKNLMERDYVVRSCDPADRRRRLIAPTQGGMDAIKSMLGVWNEIELCISDRLSKLVYTQFRELLLRLTGEVSEGAGSAKGS